MSEFLIGDDGDGDGDGNGEEEVTNLSIARGGPIYVSNMVSPLTSIPEFEASLLSELQNLKTELDMDSPQEFNNVEISVDELKILSDEELVEMAIQKAFTEKGDNNSGSLQSSQEQPSLGGQDDLSASNNKGTCSESFGLAAETSTFSETANGSHETSCNTIAKRTNSRKRKKETSADDESYLAKVDEVLKIKQKQDQNKAAVQLHSFNVNSMNARSANLFSDKSERMKSLRSINSRNQHVKSSDIKKHIAVRQPEVVLCVEVFHFKRKSEKIQEFLVLGRQTLTEMRDKILCSVDQMMQKAGQYDPSGYFLIEDVFCNDLRDPSAIDYSEPIFEWLRNSKNDALRKWECIISGESQQKQKAVLGDIATPCLPKFRRVDMQSTRFCDLRFRLGAGYLYCHQGGCKHSIVIRDMRLMHPDDVQNRAAYPIVVFQLKVRDLKCRVCNINRATKMTVDDKWAPYNPCHFCDDCYYLLHYSQDCSLLYTDFSSYDYMHD